MTDQYYQQEDNLPDTPETIVANHDAQLVALDGLVQRTAEQVNAAEQILGGIYQEAEQRGDQNAMVAISNAWQITNDLAVRVTQYDAARLASAAMMKKMADYSRAISGELDDIQTALNDRDEFHPKLRDFVEDVRDQWNEDEGEQMFSDAMEIAYENVYTDLHENIRELTGSENWYAINGLFELMQGQQEYDATDEQRDLLRKLLATIPQPEQS